MGATMDLCLILPVLYCTVYRCAEYVPPFGLYEGGARYVGGMDVLCHCVGPACAAYHQNRGVGVQSMVQRQVDQGTAH